MSEQKLKGKRVRGFAGLIATVLMPLNENPKFKEMFKKTERKFLINATNVNFAAIVTIDKGTLTVESIPNKPKENLKKKNIGWDGFVSMHTMTFMGMAMGRISLFKMGLKMLTGKVKIRGPRKLLGMLKLFKLLG